MSQSNAIAAALAVAFFIFITMRGELPKYAALLVGGSGGADGAPSGEEKSDGKMGGLDGAVQTLNSVNTALGTFKKMANI